MYCSSTKVTALALLAASVAAKVIVVNVGQGGFTYSPNNIKAVAGDHVEFHFFGEHTAVSGDFSKPCSPATTGFYSGQMQSKVSPLLPPPSLPGLLNMVYLGVRC